MTVVWVIKVGILMYVQYKIQLENCHTDTFYIDMEQSWYLKVTNIPVHPLQREQLI